MLSRQEFHDMMNRNRLRHPSFNRGDKTFKKLDKNKVTRKMIDKITLFYIFEGWFDLHR